ncbi:hypothetical protein [Taklimakanibacter lacteus]|uniref:hypothetical protein n=1 Tax=Taklimakanibacter lacteus TaxID=2268456 RepID=UPI000E6744CF
MMTDSAEASDRTGETVSVSTAQETATAKAPRASIDRAFAALDAGSTNETVAREADASASPTPSDEEAPARFAAEARAAWQAAPETVRAETHRALRELEGGLTQYRKTVEPLKPYFALAKQHNTTVHEAMERYTALDRALLSDDRQEKLLAIQTVLDHAGLAPADYANLILDGGSKEPGADQPLHGIRQEIADLRNQIGGVTSSLAARQNEEIERQVKAFAETHPRMKDEEFADTVSRLLATRMADSLETAYDMADRLNPAAQPAQTDQTRKGQLSISGAPASGSNPVTRKAPVTARESLDRSFASLGLG